MSLVFTKNHKKDFGLAIFLTLSGLVVFYTFWSSGFEGREKTLFGLGYLCFFCAFFGLYFLTRKIVLSSHSIESMKQRNIRFIIVSMIKFIAPIVCLYQASLHVHSVRDGLLVAAGLVCAKVMAVTSFLVLR